MKRSASVAELPNCVENKRQRHEAEHHEPIKFAQLDFRCYLMEPRVPFDITFANKNLEFECHKQILRYFFCYYFSESTIFLFNIWTQKLFWEVFGIRLPSQKFYGAIFAI